MRETICDSVEYQLLPPSEVLAIPYTLLMLAEKEAHVHFRETSLSLLVKSTTSNRDICYRLLKYS